MDEILIGNIMCFAFNFVPYGWLECNGQALLVRENPALFSLIGNTFGGDGVNLFLLPNMSGASRQNGFMKFYIATDGVYPKWS